MKSPKFFNKILYYSSEIASCKSSYYRKHPTPMTIQLHPQCLLGIQSNLRN